MVGGLGNDDSVAHDEDDPKDNSDRDAADGADPRHSQLAVGPGVVVGLKCRDMQSFCQGHKSHKV